MIISITVKGVFVQQGLGHMGQPPDLVPPVRIRCDAPAGTIQAITAILPWEMGKDGRAFLNGYQTWTYCPECGTPRPGAGGRSPPPAGR